MISLQKTALGCLIVGLPLLAHAQSTTLYNRIDKTADGLTDKLIAWRRDFHQNPELGNREFRTSGKVAAHLQALGMEVKVGVAKTGVVGILKGGKPGPVVALRADMDGLPVVERGNLPFKSTATTEFNGAKTGVMHACGHDAHMAMLMGVAEVLASVRNERHRKIYLPTRRGGCPGG